MSVVGIADQDLMEGWQSSDESSRWRFSFPYFAGNGAKDLATVYFELEPGNRLGTHTDSAEELLLILEGTGEATVGNEAVQVESGQMVIVPPLAPHGVRNIGSSTLRVVGFFADGTVESVFQDDVMPMGARRFNTADLLAV